MDHLPENVVKDEEFAPAVLQQLHLVVHLVGEKHLETSGSGNSATVMFSDQVLDYLIHYYHFE